jgi:hypothetical protein
MMNTATAVILTLTGFPAAEADEPKSKLQDEKRFLNQAFTRKISKASGTERPFRWMWVSTTPTWTVPAAQPRSFCSMAKRKSKEQR